VSMHALRASILTGMAALFLALALPACAQENLPNGPGKDVFAKVCSACHGLDRPMGLKRTKEAWSATVPTRARRRPPQALPE
jgi:mono/diheme cytochrome c family protein